jgi:hypothetical protein
MHGEEPTNDWFGREVVPWLFILIFVVTLIWLGVTGH